MDYLEVFDVNEGIIKADANVSVKESGYTRVEIKNITGFKEIERALDFGISRQFITLKKRFGNDGHEIFEIGRGRLPID